MRFALTVSGATFSMGISAASTRRRIRPLALLDRACAVGLSGVEISPALLEGEDLTAVAQYARDHQLFITLASGGYNPLVLASMIELATLVGAPIIRLAVGGARLSGDRRAQAGRWQAFLQEALAGLSAATRLAEQAGVILAVENHQDLASEELLWLCETIASPNFGLTLDTGKPLATEFARAMISYSFSHISVTRMFADADLSNLASIRVMQKAGMTFAHSDKYHVEYEVRRPSLS